MRSFRIFILLLMMSIIQVAQAAENSSSEASFFTVVFPYDSSIEGGNQVSDAAKTKSSQGSINKTQQILDQAITLGMETLLVRITGQKKFLSSAVAQGYLKNPKYWLVSYDIRPRTEDGVQIGQELVLQFSAARLLEAFKHHRVSIWPLTQRPTTLVMGSMQQHGELVRLTQDQMAYRADIEYRDYLQQMALPIGLPGSALNWVDPVSPERVHAMITNVLLTTQYDYLLSFKLSMQDNSKYELLWSVFSPSGKVFSKGQGQGANKPQLLKTMFEQVMQDYSLLSQINSKETQSIILNVSDLYKTEQVQRVEAQLQANHALIKSVKLLSIQAGLAQYEVEFHGDYQKIVNWIRLWPLTDFVSDSKTLHQVDVILNPNFQVQSGSKNSTSDKNLQGVQ